MTRILFCAFLFHGVLSLVFAQEVPTIDLEHLVTESELDIDPDDLAFALTTRLNLNKALENELQASGLFSAVQIEQLLAYRKLAGPFLSLYELQVIPAFDSAEVARLLPYLTVGRSLDHFQGTFRDMLRGSQKEIQFRWGRYLEKQEGFQRVDSSGYLGDPSQIFSRMRLRYGQRLSMGLVLEKDRGETFFQDTISGTPSFVGIHLYYRPEHKFLRVLSLGNYKVSLGQGLLLGSGLGFGKSGMAAQTNQYAEESVRPATSASESGFKRGLAASLQVGRGQLLLFYSSIPRDGSGLEYTPEGQLFAVHSLATSGLHRTASEQRGWNVLTQQSAGSSFSFLFHRGHVGIQSLLEHFSLPVQPDPKLYNRYYFQGSFLFNQSIDYALRLANGRIFGELAHQGGALAWIQGGQISLGKELDVSLVGRQFSPAYQALEATPFAEGSRAQNENGWYIGAELHPSGRWHLAAFADRWIHPWPRYQVDGTGRGKEYRLRADYVIRRRLNTYLEWRLKQTEENLSGDGGFRALAWAERWQLRMHAGVSGKNGWEWRTRLDLGGYQSPGGEREYGWVFLQDMLYRPIARPLSATARVSIFRTDSWNVRFYEYENDLLDIFVLSPYYQTGMRYYLNLRIRPLPGLTMECRFSQTRWWRPEQIGSGLDAFPGGVKSQISSQLKLVF